VSAAIKPDLNRRGNETHPIGKLLTVNLTTKEIELTNFQTSLAQYVG